MILLEILLVNEEKELRKIINGCSLFFDGEGFELLKNRLAELIFQFRL
jgi:hypothetical protein